MKRSGMRKQFGFAGILTAAGIMTAVLAATLVATPARAQVPAGWKARIDNSHEASDPDGSGRIKLAEENGGYHATNPQAAAYWNPANTATGNYALKGTFTVLRPTSHFEYYGLIFGGSDLEGAKQDYLYFMVAGNGRWLFKRRIGDDTEEIAGPSPNKAVKTPGPDGRATNALEVRVQGDKIECLINGTVVHTAAKTGETAKTDGIYGFRINHLLEVQVEGFGLTKL